MVVKSAFETVLPTVSPSEGGTGCGHSGLSCHLKIAAGMLAISRTPYRNPRMPTFAMCNESMKGIAESDETYSCSRSAFKL